MSRIPSVKKTASPISTGGGGTVFELLVGSYYLISLLEEELPLGLDSGTITEVKFQQRYNNSLLDDIVVTTSEGVNTFTLFLQVKRNLKFTRSDEMFCKVISDCWETLNGQLGDFDKKNDKIGIGLGIRNTKVERHFQQLIELAKNTIDAKDFIKKTNVGEFSSKEKKEYIRVIREILIHIKKEDVKDIEIWEFFRSLVILYFDFQKAGSSDKNLCINKIMRNLKTPSTSKAEQVFDSIYTIVSELSPNAGIIDNNELRKRLVKFSLNNANKIKEDYERLKEHSKLILGSIRSTIGGKIHLPRIDIINELNTSLESKQIVIISGPPMVGKSAILKQLANNVISEGDLIMLSTDYFSGTNLDNFLNNIGVSNSFNTILSSLGSSEKRYILIDGLEKSLEEDKKRTMMDILTAVNNYNNRVNEYDNNSNYNYKIIFTCRINYVQNAIKNLYLYGAIEKGLLKEIVINQLTKKEVVEVSKTYKLIKPLINVPKFMHFLSKPYILDKIVQQKVILPTNIPDNISDIWFFDWIWKELVRRAESYDSSKGKPDSRENILLTLATNYVQGNNSLNVSDIYDFSALDGLESDDIVIRKNGEIRFQHDVLKDWSIVLLLERHKNDLSAFLTRYNEPIAITEAFRLFFLKQLELQNDTKLWYSLISGLKNNKNFSPRWYLTALLSPVHSSRIETNLNLVNDLFFNESMCFDFLKTFRSTCVRLNPITMPVFGDLPEPEFEKIGAYWTLPESEKWTFVIKTLLKNKQILKGKISIETGYIFEKYMSDVEDNEQIKKEITKYCLSMVVDELLDDYNESPREQYISTILLSANYMPDKVDEFVQKYALRGRTTNNYGFEELILKSGWIPLCRYLPKTALFVLKAILCEEIESDEFGNYHHLLIDYGTSMTNWYPPTYFKGPFLGFLRMHEEEGIELINYVINHATECWKLGEQHEFNRIPLAQEIKYNEKVLSVYGNERVFQWFRYPSTAPSTVNAALMALEYWMMDEIKKGRDSKELFNKVIIKTKSVAIIGVLTSVALFEMTKFFEIIIPILENPVFWMMDFYRAFEDTRAVSSINALNQFLRNNSNDNKILINLAKQNHRLKNLSLFLPTILLQGSEQNRNYIQSKVREFPNNPPLLYEDEKNNKLLLEERLKTCKFWAAQAELENYEYIQGNNINELLIKVKLPDDLEEIRKAETLVIDEKDRLYKLQVWASDLLNQNITHPWFSLESSLYYAKILVLNDDHNYQPSHFLEESESRAMAIAQYSAAMSLRKWQWIQDNGYTEWFKEQIIVAATRKEPESHTDKFTSLFEWGYRRSAARSLPLFLSKHPNDVKIRKLIISLSNHDNYEVNAYLFDAMKLLWDNNIDVIWKCINSIILKSIKESLNSYYNKRESQYTRIKKIILSKSSYIALNSLNKCSYRDINTNRLIAILYCIPYGEDINKIDSKTRNLLEKLLYFTMNCYKLSQEGRRYNKWAYNHWNEIFFSKLSTFLIYRKQSSDVIILDSLFKNWYEIPDMIEEFIRQLFIVRIEPEYTERFTYLWNYIGKTVLGHQGLKSGSSEFKNILGLIIFSDPTGIIKWKQTEWEALDKFIPLVEQWCITVGHYPQYFGSLVQFFSNIGFNIFPEVGIYWIHYCITKSKNYSDFIKKSRTSSQLSELLYDSWTKQNKEINSEKVYIKFIYLVDIIAEQGEPLAIKLQSKLAQKS